MGVLTHVDLLPRTSRKTILISEHMNGFFDTRLGKFAVMNDPSADSLGEESWFTANLGDSEYLQQRHHCGIESLRAECGKVLRKSIAKHVPALQSRLEKDLR